MLSLHKSGMARHLSGSFGVEQSRKESLAWDDVVGPALLLSSASAWRQLEQVQWEKRTGQEQQNSAANKLCGLPSKIRGILRTSSLARCDCHIVRFCTRRYLLDTMESTFYESFVDRGETFVLWGGKNSSVVGHFSSPSPETLSKKIFCSLQHFPKKQNRHACKSCPLPLSSSPSYYAARGDDFAPVGDLKCSWSHADLTQVQNLDRQLAWLMFRWLQSLWAAFHFAVRHFHALGMESHPSAESAGLSEKRMSAHGRKTCENFFWRRGKRILPEFVRAHLINLGMSSPKLAAYPRE